MCERSDLGNVRSGMLPSDRSCTFYKCCDVYCLVVFVLAAMAFSDACQALVRQSGDIAKSTTEFDGGKLILQLEKPDSRYSSVPAYSRIAGSHLQWIAPLESGGVYKFRLELKGCSGSEFEFDRVETSCQCGRVVFQGNTVSAEHALVGELVWRVPKSSQTGHSAVTFTLLSGKEVRAEVRLCAYLSGSVNVGMENDGVRIDEGFYRWDVPVLVTSPFSIGGLKVDLSTELKGFTVTLEKSGLIQGDDIRQKSSGGNVTIERGIVQILAHESVVGNQFRFGNLLITSSDKPGAGWSKSLSLSIRPLVRISPLRLEFRDQEVKVGDANSDAEAVEAVNQPVKAIALVQIDQTLFQGLEAAIPANLNEDRENRGASEVAAELLATGKIKVSLQLGLPEDEPAPVTELELKHLGRQVFRVSASCEPSRFQKGELTGHWLVTVGEREFSVPVDAFVHGFSFLKNER